MKNFYKTVLEQKYFDKKSDFYLNPNKMISAFDKPMDALRHYEKQIGKRLRPTDEISVISGLDENGTRFYALVSMDDGMNTEVRNLKDIKDWWNEEWDEKSEIVEEETTVTEASLQRLESHLKQGHPMLFISGHRGENSPSKNRANTWLLKRHFNISGFGYNEIEGHYPEEDENGNLKEVDEVSLVVYATPENEQKLLDLGMSVGKFLDQSSIMFIDSEGNGSYISTRDDSWVGSTGSKLKLGKFRKLDKNEIVDAFSKIQGKKFVFDSVSEEKRGRVGQYNEAQIRRQYLENLKKHRQNCVQEWEKLRR